MSAERPYLKGVTISDLAVIFGKKYAEAKELIEQSGIKPTVITATGAKHYSIKQAARYLMPTVVNDPMIVDKILAMNHKDLPPELSRAYWSAKSVRNKFLLENGDLWPTLKVVEKAGEAFKSLRLSLQLFADAIEREHGLSEKQREILQRLVDATLNDMRERLIDGFADKREPTSSGPPPSEEDDREEEI